MPRVCGLTWAAVFNSGFSWIKQGSDNLGMLWELQALAYCWGKVNFPLNPICTPLVFAELSWHLSALEQPCHLIGFCL